MESLRVAATANFPDWPLVYFFDWNVLNGGDWVFHFDQQLSTISHFGIYYGAFNFGEVSAFPNNWIFYQLYVFLSFCHINWDAGTRILFLVPIVFCTPYFSYLFFRDFLKNDLASFFAASIYSFNTFFLKLQLDDLTYGYIW